MKPVVHAPDPILTTPTKPVTSFDASLGKLISEMKDTLTKITNPKGVGLAASQIGEPYRIFVTKPKENVPARVFINPEIVKHTKDVTDGVPERKNKLEGCLSISNLWGKVRRNTSVTLRFQDELGVEHTEKFTGFAATIIQHEVDHLDGILFTQRVLEQNGSLFEMTKDDGGKEVLTEMHV
jgi:peptide deformylase